MTAPDNQVRLAADTSEASRSGTEHLRRWWVWTGGAGLGLLLVPVLALVLTNRAPDAVFLGYWWSPIASVPTDTLTIGTLGLTLLLATGLALTVTAPPRRWRFGRLVGVALVAGITALACVGVLVTVFSKADVSGAAIRAVLLRQQPATEVSGQARRAFQLALGWPAPTAAGIHVLHRSSVPAGPWLVQTTEVLNQNLADEGSDVDVGTLINPVTGDIEAAWFYGL